MLWVNWYLPQPILNFQIEQKSFENTCLIINKWAINSKIQNKMPPASWLEKAFPGTDLMFQFYLPYNHFFAITNKFLCIHYFNSCLFLFYVLINASRMFLFMFLPNSTWTIHTEHLNITSLNPIMIMFWYFAENVHQPSREKQDDILQVSYWDKNKSRWHP